jgi:hypothetical protein
MIMSQHQPVQVFAYIDNVTLTCPGTVREAYAAYDDLQQTITKDLTLRLNQKECCIYVPVLSEHEHAHARARAAFEVIQQERILQNKDTLTLFTHEIIMLGSPIGTATYTRDSAITTAPFSPKFITLSLPFILLQTTFFTFASFSRASPARFAASCVLFR